MRLVRDREFYKTILRISIPAAFQSLIGLLVSLVDDIMVSELGEVTYGAVAQSNSITALYASIIMGITGGSAVLISQYWGKKDTERIKQVFSVVMTICLCVSLLAVIAIRLCPGTVLMATISADKSEMMQIAVRYFTIVCFSFIPMAVSTSLIGMLRCVELVNVALAVSIISLFTNIFFNWVLIFGRLGFPKLGVEGAAIATIIARVVEMCVMWYYTFYKQKRLDIKPRSLIRAEGWLWRDYARYGLPVGVLDTQWAIVGLIKAAFIGRMSQTFVASNGYTSMFLNLGSVFTFALSGGACVVIGKTVGAKQYDKTREYSNTIQVMFLLIGILMSGLLIIFRDPFIALFSPTADAQALASAMSLIGAVTLIGTSYHAACFVGINRGAGDNRFVMWVDMICGWGVVLPAMALAIFAFKWPPEVVFFLTRIDQCFKWIIAFIRLRGDKWIKNVTRDFAPACN